MYCMVYIVYHSPPDTCCSVVRFSSDRIESSYLPKPIFRPSFNIFLTHMGLVESAMMSYTLTTVTKQQSMFLLQISLLISPTAFVYMYICMYVCMYVQYVHMYVCMYICIYMMTESKIKETRYSITSRIQRNRIWCRYMAFIP